MTVRVLALTRYGSLGASSRIRFMQYLPALAAADVQVAVQPLFDDSTLTSRYRRGGYGLGTALHRFRQRISTLWARRQFDLLWIEKEALPWWPLWIELLLLRRVPYVLDYDDAVFHNYDQHSLAVVRYVFGRRLDGLMSRARLVIGGNDYLAQRARDAGAAWVDVLPTVIDLARYPYSHSVQAVRKTQLPIVVWIGSPSTVRYLHLLKAPLQALAQRLPFVLRVIGGEFSLPGVQVESVPWSQDTEVESIASADVGVMPLVDSPWERGKCGYKLIQYMACGLPVVASPVGVNSSIVKEGVNGFLAEESVTWENRLVQLLSDGNLRMTMGAAGRLSVEREYCIQVTGSRLAALLNAVAQKDE